MHSTHIYSSKIKGGPNTEITNIYYFLANKNITMKELQSHIAQKKREEGSITKITQFHKL